ncbi:MAG: serine/threonine protein kinase [Vicinamibacteria bacterium]|nr:serine/threonine protein kinase [Vicinamibacteria bacterium]
MEPDPRVVRLAAAAADGAAVDWDTTAANQPATRVLATLAAEVRARVKADAGRIRESLSGSTRLLCALAAVRALVGVGLTLDGAEPVAAAPLLAFAATATVLIYAGDRDPRAERLGVFYLLVAAALSARPIARLADRGDVVWASILSVLPAEAFLSAAFLALARRFPAAPEHLPAQRVLARLERVAVAAGALLFAATFLAPWAGEGIGRLMAALSRSGPDRRGSLFWALNFALIAVGAAIALRKARKASGDEGRRVAAFVVAVFAGLAPLVGLSLAAIVVPGVDGWIDRHEASVEVAVYGGLISIPISTAGAVAAGRVLGLRLIARRAASYVLARTSLGALVLLPATLLSAHLYVERDRPLVESLGAGHGQDLLRWTLVVALLGLARGPLSRAIDRLFSRGEGDRGAALHRLLTELTSARGRADVARALSAEIQRSLGATQVRAFLRDPRGRFVAVDRAPRALGADSALVALLEADPRPLDLTAASFLRLLPEPDRAWACDQGVLLVVPVPGSSGEPAGLLALGERESEQPWDREAQELASGLASAAGIALSRAAVAPAEDGASGDDEPGLECGSCSRVRHGTDPACACGARGGRPAALPAVVLGKFALVRRLGAGGMGIVYQAEDLALGRTVALKTLPRLSSALALRLRSEARVMASIDHPGVATLFGAETWKGVPFLVVEFLPGETLAERLQRGPLTLDAGLAVTRSLAGTLADLHESGFLHRDLKPGNVGFRSDGGPKLLDFGLAQLIELGREGEGLVAGTPRYLPPEAWDGVGPSPAWDVWALAVVVHETIAGRHPFQASTEQQTLESIRHGAAERLSPHLAPAWLAELVQGALAREPRLRTVKSARAFVSALAN